MHWEQISGVFNNLDSAERAISALKDHGVDGNEISVVRRSDGKGMPTVEHDGSHGLTVTTVEDASAGALKGGAMGIALGVLAGAIALSIPGVGPILAAGPLWAAFGATVATGAAGAALGGVVGYLVDQGVPADKAHIYAGAIARGDVLISVRAEHIRSSDVVLLLQKYGAEEIGHHSVGATQEPDADPPVVDLTAAEREMRSESTVVPVITPLTPSMPALPGPIGR